MSSSRTSSCSNTNSKQRKHFPIERRPRMLKEFLVDDSNSCSSSGFISSPRRIQDSSMRSIIHSDLYVANSSNTKRLLRSRSKAAASTTISAFQAVINAVKSFQFNVVKSPSNLPRSLSQKLSRKNSNMSKNKETDIKMTVRVKDIIRWKSFRDLIEEKPQPLDLASSPDHYCTTTTTTTTTTTESTDSTPCSSNGSSWCDSDFTSEYLSSWSGNSEGYAEQDVQLGKKHLPCVVRGSTKATTGAAVNPAVGPKQLACEEKEQRSPVSVIDCELEEDEGEEDEGSPLSFDQTLASMEKTNRKLMHRIRRFESLAEIDPINLDKWISMEEITDDGCGDDDDDDDEEEEEEEAKEYEEVNEVEEKAKLLLNHVKATNRNHRSKIDDIDGEILKRALAWIKGEHSATLIDKEACIGEMDGKESWSKCVDEQEAVALQIENALLNVLVAEALADLL